MNAHPAGPDPRRTSEPHGGRRLRCAAALTGAVVLVGAVGLLQAVPAAAQPGPVSPTVVRTDLSGVDPQALANVPAALDPDAVAVRARSAGPAPRVGRVRPDRRPLVLTGELPAPSALAAGVSWTSSAGQVPTGVVVQVRVKERGSWSDWEVLALADAADPGSADARRAGTRIATEPLSSASAEAVQVRVDTVGSASPSGLRLTTVDAGRSTADASAAAAATTVTGTAAGRSTVAAQPTVVTRAQWGADESLRTCTPSYSSTIKAGFVHHTVNSNTYSAADSAALVRAIYAYHVNGNGWCDIGYNVLVDRFGTIFEGRYGGLDRPVIGAQAGGFNTDTFGVAGIGDFSTAQPGSAMLDAYARIIGWKLSLHGVDPLGSTVLTSAGGPATGYAAGTRVTVRTVSGHRDVDLTDCPGDALYTRLGGLATAAAQYISTTSSPPFTLPAGQTLRSPNGAYLLAMQTDGNLVVYGRTGPTWATNTFMPYSYAAIQGAGNLVVLDRTDGSTTWTANTSGIGNRLVMQDDGNLVLYSSAGSALWDSKGYSGHSALLPAPTKTVVGSLGSGQAAVAPNRAYQVVMQTDGNLVTYDATGRPLWASGTRVPGSRLVMQGDGNLVVYTPQGRPDWASATWNNPQAFALLGNDGRFAVYRTDGTRAWST